jgi:hypothetical protein
MSAPAKTDIFVCNVLERFRDRMVFLRQPEESVMRACFLGQNVTALGFGVAMLQTPPLPEPETPPRDGEKKSDSDQEAQEHPENAAQAPLPKNPA